jgi:RND family efflux transporter MFP subunit
MHMRQIVIPALVMAALATLSTAALSQERAAPVGVDKVRLEPLTQTSPVIGRLVSRKTGPVAARTRGPIDEVVVSVGDHVETGDVIARLNVSRQEAELELRKAEVAQFQARIGVANASLRKTQQELQRMESLRQSAAFQKGRLEDLQQDVAEARASLAVARAEAAKSEAAVRQAQIELDDSSIRAPYPGVITVKHVESGDWVDAGQAVVTLLNDIDLEVEAAVPSKIISGVAAGVVVKFRMGEEDYYDAVIRAVIPEENPLTRTRIVRATPDIPEGITLAAGQSVILLVPIGEPRDVVTVHKDAVLNRGGANLVVLVIDGKAEFRPIALGAAVGSRFEVLDGLQPGDVAVVRGNERLRPGQPVSAGAGKQGGGKAKEAPAPTTGAADEARKEKTEG